jgi:L-glyceraldehyde 3-phosphate reductase
LKVEEITEAVRARLRRLNEIASARGQSLAQMALAWVLRSGRVTSVLIGASKPSQLDDCAGVVGGPPFNSDEIAMIDSVLATELASADMDGGGSND